MNDKDIFLIYQLQQTEETRLIRFEPLELVKFVGMAVERGNYNHMYTGTLEPGVTPEDIYHSFNLDRPQDFTGHSLSVSDIVVLRQEGKLSAHYVDRIGFLEVPEFLSSPYRYYLTQRPVDIGTFPKTGNSPVQIVNFNKREWMENATFRAWGCLAYDTPLSEKQISDYELRAASDNPDRMSLSPYQLEAQAQLVGQWEQSRRIPNTKRLTWWHPDFGVFVKKEFVTREQLAERFGQIAEAASRVAHKKPIVEQLMDAGRQAGRGDAPPEMKNSHDHGDR